MTKNELYEKFKTSGFLVLFIWAVYLIDLIIPFNLNNLGITPRSIPGLIGIPLSPMLHAGLWHIMSNTLPLLILSFVLFISYPKHALPMMVFGIIVGGSLVWIMGRASTHVGASGLIYAMAAFLIAAGFFSKSVKHILVSLLIIILYGGLVWGVFPTRPWVSWEGHLFGALSGVLYAYLIKSKLTNTKL